MTPLHGFLHVVLYLTIALICLDRGGELVTQAGK